MIGNIIETIEENIIGRLCNEHNNVRYLLETVRDAGDGDYLEIGVLHGGSLCAVAMLKKRLGQKGMCYGIDPLDGYYMTYFDKRVRGWPIDKESGVPVSISTVEQNVKLFDVSDRVNVIQAKSDPFSFDGKVAVTYIDGDHWGDMPTRDWMNVNPITDHYVVFDNDDEEHPSVQQACEFAINDVRWDLCLREGITFIVKRAGSNV